MFRLSSKQIKIGLTDLQKTAWRFVLFTEYYWGYVTEEKRGGAFITRVKETTMQGEEKETSKMQLIWCLLSNFYLNMFRASLCPSSGEQECVHCRIWCSALVVLAVVVWSWDASCVHSESYCSTPAFISLSQYVIERNSVCLFLYIDSRLF